MIKGKSKSDLYIKASKNSLHLVTPQFEQEKKTNITEIKHTLVFPSGKAIYAPKTVHKLTVNREYKNVYLGEVNSLCVN